MTFARVVAGWVWRPLMALMVVASATIALSLPSTAAGAASGGATLSQASTSTRGVTGSTINVVFPVANLDALASTYGFAGDVEYTEQAKAIHLFVDQINDGGGINGRRINPIITSYDPADNAEMQKLCVDWTQGNPGVFAVLDGVGTYTGVNQLCVAQQGHTPLLSQWTTVSSFTQQASPYLWWTGPDDAGVLRRARHLGHVSGNDRRQGEAGCDRRRPGQRPGRPAPITPSRPPACRCDTPDRDHPGADLRVGLDRQRRHPRRREAAPGRRDVGDPADPLQRVPAGVGGTDATAVLPQAPAVGLREFHRDVPGAPRPLREGAQRAGGRHDRDAGWHRRPAAVRAGRLRPRRAELLDRLAQGVPRDSQRGTSTTTSKSRARCRAGVRRSASSPKRRRRRAGTSTAAPSCQRCHRSRISRAAIRRS